MKRILLCVLAAVWGCSPVGPDYQLPQQALVNAPEAQSPFVGAGSSAADQAMPPDGWWRLYEDPELNRLVEDALAANTDLRAAEANLERSRALVAQARAGQEVEGGFNFDPAYGQLSAEQYLQPRIIAPAGLYDLGVAASYELDLFGGIRRGIEAARAEDEAVQAARDLVRITVVAQVAGAYVDLCGAGAQIATAQHVVELQKDRLNYLQRLTDAGRGTRLDITRAQGLLAQTQADIPSLEARRRNALFLLATLSGKPPVAFDRTLDCRIIPALTRPIPVGDGAALLKRRPDVRRAERELAAATARIGIVTADLYPRITLGGSLGSTGLLSDIFDPLTNRFAVGPAIHWNLNQSATRARIEQAEAVSRAALAQFDGVVLRALREVESALNVYTRALERDASIQAARERAAQALADAQTLERAGRATSLETLDAERTLAAAESAATASRVQIAADQVALFLALGGGWRATGVRP